MDAAMVPGSSPETSAPTSLAAREATAHEVTASGKLIRTPWGSTTGVQILATGAYAPEAVLTNAELARLGCDEAWIIQRTGIRERRIAAANQATSDLALAATQQCLQRAGCSAKEIDLLLVCTMTPDHLTPSTACLVQHALGATCAAIDMNAACSGFMYGLITAAQFVRSGVYRRVLVIGAEVMSRTIDPADLKTVPLFGDGAGAILLGAGEASQGLLTFNLGSDGGGACFLNIPGGGSREPLTADRLEQRRQFMLMDGKPVFKWAVRIVAEALLGAMEHAGVTSDEIALVIMHQANARILDAISSDIGFPAEKIVKNLDRFGNTSAASIPLALHEAAQAGRIQRGDLILLCGFGAGLTWGVSLVRW
jgi:3-oxoacyl-[acyl-carrier-protein] synthase III